LEKKLSRAQKFKLEGRCQWCGKWSYPYSLCHEHRIKSNIIRVFRKYEKCGWVDVTIDKVDGQKIYKWNNTAPEKTRKYSPESIAKMSLPRLKGKPMTEEVIGKAILDVLNVKGFPMTEREINKGIKTLKTVGQIVPETEDLITEYNKIQRKESSLSRSQRNAVEMKISFLVKRGIVKEGQIKTPL
jgi:hypothetical protein